MRNSAIINIRKLYSEPLYSTNGRTRVYAYTENIETYTCIHVHIHKYIQRHACCGCCLHPLPASLSRSSQILHIIRQRIRQYIIHTISRFLPSRRLNSQQATSPDYLTFIESHYILQLQQNSKHVPFFLLRFSIPVAYVFPLLYLRI